MRLITALLLILASAGLVSADTPTKKIHDARARAAWAWVRVQKNKNVAPKPVPMPQESEECRCARGYRCDCDDCQCDGCPAKRGWTWSDDEGGYWWKPNPDYVVPRFTPAQPAFMPAYVPAYNPVGFPQMSSGRSGGC